MFISGFKKKKKKFAEPCYSAYFWGLLEFQVSIQYVLAIIRILKINLFSSKSSGQIDSHEEAPLLMCILGGKTPRLK